MAETLTIFPEQIHAGDTILFQKDISAYPVADGWILKYRIVGITTLLLTATAGLITITAVQSATLQAGWYAVVGWAERTVNDALERNTIFTGQLEVLQNLTTITSQDGRSYWQKLLDAIRASMAGRATRQDEEMTLPGGKTVRLLSPAQLMQWEAKVSRKIRAEQGKSRNVNYTFPTPT
jgi:hypothetical protein